MTPTRTVPVEMSPEEFANAGHRLIDEAAAFLGSIRSRPVTPGETPQALQELLGDGALPENGTGAAPLLSRAAGLLFDHSLLNGHPKFFGYITSSAVPLGALADLLAAVVNPNVGMQSLSPVATEIEKQTIRWLSDLVGVPAGYGGLLVSGGNMANFTAFLAARTAKAPAGFAKEGLAGAAAAMTAYASDATHTWIHKAAIHFGHGTDAVRLLPADGDNKLDAAALDAAVRADKAAGKRPFLAVANAGDVSTGAVDDLRALGAVCREHGLWLHVDGAYGLPAAAVPELKSLFDGLEEADSIAMDPHKWLYVPLEAGCTLVRDPRHLEAAFSAHPSYYAQDADDAGRSLNYHEYGMQNSRGFRALKVWLALQQAGRAGYARMIADDIRMAAFLYDRAAAHADFEAVSRRLSIANFRFVPAGLAAAGAARERYLNALNEALVMALQKEGGAFLSNAVVRGAYCLRACVVNFRTTEKDMEEVLETIAHTGQRVHAAMKKAEAHGG